MTPEERLVRSLSALRALIDSLAARPSSEAKELLRLDRLVRKYPAAARVSLHFRERPPTDVPVPPGWSPTWDLEGLPLWRWSGGRLCVATGDMDQLRFLSVALGRFDRMTAEQLHAYLRDWADGQAQDAHRIPIIEALRLFP